MVEPVELLAEIASRLRTSESDAEVAVRAWRDRIVSKTRAPDALVSGTYRGARIRDFGLFKVKYDPLEVITFLPDGRRTQSPPFEKALISFHSDIVEWLTP